MTPFDRVLRLERRNERQGLLAAGVCAALATATSIALLGLSGWFITGAALAGLSGAAFAFNYMLPSAAIRLFAITRTAGRYGERVLGHAAAFNALARIRPRLFLALAGAPPAEALALSAGEASARLVQDVGAIEILFIRRSAVWSAVAAAAAGAGLAALASPWAGGAVIVLFCAAFLGARLIALRLGEGPGQAVQKAVGRLKDEAAALGAAAPELVCYGLTDWAQERIGAAEEDLLEAQKALDRAGAWQGAYAHVMAALAAGTALVLASGAAPALAALAAFAAAAAMEAAAGLARAFLNEGAVAEAGRRLSPLMGDPEPGAILVEPLDPHLRLMTADGPLSLPRGARLSVTGPSGSGKTTLLEQVIGLRAAPPGRVLVGGLPVEDRLHAVRALFAYAPQEAFLFSGTVRENLGLGGEADEEALWSALHDAALDDRIRRLPDGLDTYLGEGGARFSGGERRRLSLARALMRSAPWLLLDEPTEGLDAATEALVVERLGRRLAASGQGLILVSHRPAPLVLCSSALCLSARGSLLAA